MKISYALTAFAGAIVGFGFCGAIFLLVVRPIETNQDSLFEGDVDAEWDTVIDIDPDPESQLNAKLAESEFNDVKTLADTLAFKSDFDQTLALYKLLARADEALVLDLIRQTDLISSVSQKDAALAIIFSKYASIDPSRALKNAESLGEEAYLQLIPRIFHVWSKDDLDSALDASDAFQGNRRRIIGYSILTSRDDLEPSRLIEIATQFNLLLQYMEIKRQARLRESLEDPRSAWIGSFQKGDPHLQSQQTRLAIARAWITKEGVNVLPDIFVVLPPGEQKNAFLSHLVPTIVQTDPEGALKLISALPPDRDARRFHYDVFDAWGRLDPESALETLNVSESQDQRRLFDRFLYNWARKDPRGLLEKSSKMPHESKLKAQVSAIQSLASSSPHEATSHLEELPELKQRDDVVQGIARIWSENDPVSALEWYLNLDMEDSVVRRSGVHTLTMRLTAHDPDLALRLADQTPGELGNMMVRGVFNELAYADAEDAITFVSRVKNDRKKFAMKSIGYEMAQKNIREAVSFSGQLDQSLQEPYIEAVVDYALRSSRARATMVEIFDVIQVQELKTRAAVELLYENVDMGFLSKTERQKMYSVLDQEQRREFDEYVESRLENASVGPSRGH